MKVDYKSCCWGVLNRVESATEGRKQRPCPPAACLWQQQRHTAGRRLSQWRASEQLPPPTLCSPSTVQSPCPSFTWPSMQVESRKSQLKGEVIVGGSCSMNLQCLAIGHSRVMEGQWCYQLYHSTQLVDTVRGTLGWGAAEVT